LEATIMTRKFSVPGATLVFRGASWRGVSALAIVALLFLAPAARAYPPAGIDAFDSVGAFRVSSQAFGIVDTPVVLTGPTQIRRGDAYDPGDGLLEIDTQIEQMALSGSTAIGNVLVKVIAPAPGKIKQKQAGVDFPADSWFLVRVEVQIASPFGNFRLFSDPNRPIRLMAMIDAIPPFGAQYMPEGTFAGVDLVDEAGQVVGLLSHIGHFVGQHPTFSVAPEGTSNLIPADLLGRPTAPRIRAAGLGLVSGDNVDGLSYGLDNLFQPLMDIRFSVDANAVGRLGSHVRREADKSPKQAHGDEFRVTPFAQSGGGSNVQVLDENGDTSPPFPLQGSDDVDALAEQPPEFADADGDGTPEREVYFSLSKGSPSLATLSASAADVLVTKSGAAPTIFIPHTELGLAADDDIDAVCLSVSGRDIAYSLAPGSPSLGTQSAADVFLETTLPAATPTRWFRAANLGLEEADNLNALKCKSGEIDEFGQSQLRFILLDGQSTEQVTLACRSGHNVGTLDGRTGAGQNRGVPVYLSSLICEGTSRAGAIKLRLRASSEFPNELSRGQIFDATDDTRLDIMPWGTGTATMDLTLFLNLDIGTVTGLHHPTGIPLRGQITGKPPKPGEALNPRTTSTASALSLSGDGGPVEQAGATPLFREGGVATNFSITQVVYVPDARPKPTFAAAGFTDAAAFGAPPSPGGLASLFGTFDTTLDVATAIPLPRVLGNNVQVRFQVNAPAAAQSAAISAGGVNQAAQIQLPAPLLFVSPTQINLQIPWEVSIASGTVTAIVSVNGADSAPVQLPVGPVSPGVFTFDFGPGRAVAINPDGSVAHPAGSVPGLTSRPAVAGAPITLFVTGLGVTSPGGVTGDDSYDAAGNFVRRDTATPATVRIGGMNAPVVFSGLSPEFVGVFQINATVPAGVTPGNQVPLVIEIGGRVSRNDVTIAVAAP
jgi:uncharacterized protein (TIGR03437 family)